MSARVLLISLKLKSDISLGELKTTNQCNCGQNEAAAKTYLKGGAPKRSFPCNDAVSTQSPTIPSYSSSTRRKLRGDV